MAKRKKVSAVDLIMVGYHFNKRHVEGVTPFSDLHLTGEEAQMLRAYVKMTVANFERIGDRAYKDFMETFHFELDKQRAS